MLTFIHDFNWFRNMIRNANRIWSWNLRLGDARKCLSRSMKPYWQTQRITEKLFHRQPPWEPSHPATVFTNVHSMIFDRPKEQMKRTKLREINCSTKVLWSSWCFIFACLKCRRETHLHDPPLNTTAQVCVMLRGPKIQDWCLRESTVGDPWDMSTLASCGMVVLWSTADSHMTRQSQGHCRSCASHESTTGASLNLRSCWP